MSAPVDVDAKSLGTTDDEVVKEAVSVCSLFATIHEVSALTLLRERYPDMKDYFEVDERQEMLLGMSKEVLFMVFGKPFATYKFQEKEILHYGNPELSFVEVTKGLVSRCETLPERRAAFRVQPASTITAHILTRFDEFCGVIVDLSVLGIKLSIHQWYDFRKLEEVSLSFSFPLQEVKEDITIPAFFYRMTKEDGAYTVVFHLNIYYGTEIYDKFTRFVLQRQKEMLESYRQESVSGRND